MYETISGWCSSPLWDTNMTWNTSNPYFTPCFEKTVLILLPSAYLWLFAPLEIHYLHHTKAFNIPFKFYNLSKLIIIVILGICSLAHIANCIFLYEKYKPVDIYPTLIKFFTLCLFFGLTYTNIKRGIRSSGILFIYSLLLALCGAPQFRTLIRSRYCFICIDNLLSIPLILRYEIVDFISYCTYYVSVLLLLFYNCLADEAPITILHPEDQNVCPENNSSFLSKILFTWFEGFAWKGYKKPLTDDDLWELEHEMKSAHIGTKFESRWNIALDQYRKLMERRSRLYRENQELLENGDALEFSESEEHVSILRPLYETFGSHFIFGVILKVLYDGLTFVSPQLLNLIIAFVGNKEEHLWHGYFYAVMLLVVATLQSLLLAKYYHVMYRIGLHTRTALISVLYKKTLKISNNARKEFTVGEIINLMAVDSQRFLELMVLINLLWSAPLQICLAVYFLHKIIGASVFAGLVVMIILLTLNGLIASRTKNMHVRQLEHQDYRVKLMNEMLSGIKVLKLYAWEPSFENRITRIRDKEIKILKNLAYVNAAGSAVWACAPFAVSLVTFAVFVLSSDKNVLNAQIAFVSLSLFNILRFPLAMLPLLITNMVQTKVSMKRINKFLNSEELDPTAVSHEERPESIVIKNGKFSWDGFEASPLLINININIRPGTLVAVLGPVGSGKSSLLSAMLGEMYKQSGYINTTGKIAYVPQQAWIQNATFKDNVTFGDVASKSFYDQVIEACALKADLAILPSGDDTEIGERGINLSGGQKQRLSLARAVYSKADLYLLDDPLSAVDPQVGKHIFDHVIGPNGLLKNKTRVFVTHSVTYLPQVDFIIVLKKGMISESGTYNELVEKKGDFADFLATYLKEDDDEKDEPVDDKDALSINGSRESLVPETIGQQKSSFRGSVKSLRRQWTTSKPKLPGQKLIETEKAEVGSVKWKVYAYYLGAIGPFLVTLTLLMNALYQGFAIASNYWLSVWASDAAVTESHGQNVSNQRTYLGVYALFGFGQAICVVVGSIAMYVGLLKASNYIYGWLLRKVSHWPIATFDVIPCGRIISRFGYDMDVLDNLLLNSVKQVLRQLGMVISTLLIITYSSPLFIIVVMPMAAIYYLVQRFYVATSRQLKRLESVSRSPIYSHFGETISGVQSIRAYGMESKFIQQSEKKVDINQRSYYAGVVSNRWLGVRLESVSNLIIFFSALFAAHGRHTMSAGLVGLSVSYALQITQTLNWLVRMISEVETNIVAVERIKEYGEIQQEAPWDLSDEDVPIDWPSKGNISFRNFRVRYREDLDFVLKGITFEVKGGEKIGIVGRTGAGKSSLTLSLFRIVEAAGGKIIIDGIDISKIGLHTLRGRLTIIPQDPVLFSGTLRINLDPTEKYSDDSIWEALELAHLKSYISTLNMGLQYQITEDGKNFSVGQRQLICLARALLRETKVIILDEATAAVDLETDDIIQATLRKEFKDSTVLTIAHRLNTIMDYDKIIVLEKGYVVEYDSPHQLLKSKESFFYKMADDAGLV